MNNQKKLHAACFILMMGLAPLSSLGAEPAQNVWSQWRGPSRDGSIKGTKLPESLSENSLKKIWQVKPLILMEKLFNKV